MVVKELFARLGLDVESSGFVKADALLGALSNTLAAIGAAAGVGAVAVGVLIKKTADAGDEAAKAAQAYGITTDAVQTLGYAAEFSGSSFEELSGALAFLARKGSKDVEADLRAIADTLATMPDGGEKTAFAIEKLGRSAARLIPLLNGGSKALDDFGQEAEDLGVVLDSDTVAASEALNDSLDRLWKVGLGAVRRALGPLIPEILRISEAIYKWIRRNRELIKSNLEKVARALVTAFRLLDFAATTLNDTFQWTVKWADAVALAIGSYLLASLVVAAGGFRSLGVAAAVAGAEAVIAWLKVTAPVLALGAIIFGVVLLLEDMINGFRGGESVIGNSLRAWGDAIKSWVVDLGNAGWVVVDGWITAFKDFFAWIGDQLGVFTARVMQAFEVPLKALRGLFGASPSPVGPEGDPTASVPSFGGGDSPLASASSSPASGPVLASNFNAAFNITTQPGQNPQEIAGVVRDSLDAWHNAKMRETLAAVGA